MKVALWLAVAGMAAVALATFGLAACGGDDSSESSEDQVLAVLDSMADRMADRDGAGACRYMTVAARRQMAAAGAQLAEADSMFAKRYEADGTCGATFEAIMGETFVEDTDPDIRSVEVNGDEAVVAARVSQDKNNLQRARLAKEDGEWRVQTWFVHPGGSNNQTEGAVQ